MSSVYEVLIKDLANGQIINWAFFNHVDDMFEYCFDEVAGYDSDKLRVCAIANEISDDIESMLS